MESIRKTFFFFFFSFTGGNPSFIDSFTSMIVIVYSRSVGAGFPSPRRWGTPRVRHSLSVTHHIRVLRHPEFVSLGPDLDAVYTGAAEQDNQQRGAYHGAGQGLLFLFFAANIG